MRLRDKDYLRTTDGLVFNVLGYDHADDGATCGLKYVDGVKWLDSYQRASEYLRENYPHYVDELIRVPFAYVAEIYRSEDRLPQLRSSQPSGLLQKAVELADLCAETLNLPRKAIGLTDSLLWGEGTEDSDIDLVIYGMANCFTWLQSAEAAFELPEIEPIAPEFIQRPPHLSDAMFAHFCARKWNQGYFRGTRFSVRGVRNWDETPSSLPLIAGSSVERQLTIADNRQSLFFPVVYETTDHVDVVSFQIGYEASLAPGDRVRVRGAQIDERTILIGSRYGSDESIELIPLV